MGTLKDAMLESMESMSEEFECPLCGDVIPCDKEDFELYTELGRCAHCEHVWTKND